MNTFRGFLPVALKEFKHLIRDRGSLILAVVLPIFQVCMYGYAIDLNVRHISTVLVDYDRTAESREYVDKLHATQYLDFNYRADNEEQAISMLKANTARVAVIIPPDFARKVAAHESAQVGVLLDGSDSQVSGPARTAFQVGGAAQPLVEARTNVLFNPTSKTSVFMIPGIIGLILQLVLTSLTSGSIVREREQGSFEQLMVSPIGKMGLVLGKVAPFFLLSIVEMFLIMGLGWLLFDMRVAGNFALLVLMTIPFIVASLSLGLFISAVAQTQAQALQLSTFTLIPNFLLSGFVFPRDTLPGFFSIVSNFLPLTHELVILRGVIVRGAGFGEVWPSVLATTLLAAGLLTLATSRFSKHVA
ncbi:MAG: ABC transporter permease [Armatimonadetes bacterium]|nr:ABC transporter permease [Armatimonadota bacterium]MBX3109121.1 ABC transporter permease [Fimbriimonadaceae bacterium]